MGLILRCVLGLFLLNTLLHGHKGLYDEQHGSAEDSDGDAILESPAFTLFEGDTVILRCRHRTPRNEMKVTFFKDGSPLKIDPNYQSAEMVIEEVSKSDRGVYMCKFDEGAGSKARELKVEARLRTVTLTAVNTIIPVGGRVKLTCSVEDAVGLKYEFFRLKSDTSEKHSPQTRNVNGYISRGGEYTCRGWRNKPPDFFTPKSAALTIQETVPNKATVTLQPNWLQIFHGEKITVRCEIQGGEDTKWTYEWKTTSSDTLPAHNEYIISSAARSHSGDYHCMARRNYFLTQWSDAKTLTVLLSKPKPTLTRGGLVRGAVTLTCSVKGSSGWKYDWFRQTSDSSEAHLIWDGAPEGDISVSKAGLYHCRGRRGDPRIFTEESNKVPFHEILSNSVVVSLQPSWTRIFKGETITIRCEIQGGERTKWTYQWTPNKLNSPPTHNEYRIESATDSHNGYYRCKGRRSSYSSTNWSNGITLTVSPYKPRAVLSADSRDIPVGGSVTLTCSVNPPSLGWKYFWYGEEHSSKSMTKQDDLLLTGQISVSQEGLYWCVAGRGDPVYYTEYSSSVPINKNVANKAVVTLQPNWSKIYKGETITLRCEIKDGGDSKWDHEWTTTSSDKPSKRSEHGIGPAAASHSGTYKCKGRVKSSQTEQRSSTDWSDPIELTVSDNEPRPVLTVSPLWLSPGDSVTLNCGVEHPSAGWRFFWYKAVPNLSNNDYNYELLPDSINGTEQDSFIVHGQKHSAGYVCRAGRGHPVYYTYYSEPKFVWSGDVHSSASLTVNPDRVQHFTSDSVSLSCGGNSTEWRVRKSTERRNLLHCAHWATMTASTCNIARYWFSNTGVYWCESGSGQFSNAVNITTQNKDIILVSPVRPVTEGASVSLSCKARRQYSPHMVFFYRNDELIQNDTRMELNISAVSKSDEGFYKCKYAQKESPQSWMSVKAASRPEDSIFPVSLSIGLVCGIVLILLLLLLCRYRLSTDSCFIRRSRSESTNQGSATSHMVYQNEAQRNEYSSPLEDEADSQDVNYSLIELKHVGKKRTQHEPEESTVYSDVMIRTADDNLMYAQVNCHNKGKAKKNKGKSTPTATDETVYSEVKPGTACGL